MDYIKVITIYQLMNLTHTHEAAKASWGLAFRIIEHLEEMGLLKVGDCILDPMAGTGRFLLAACAKGYRAVGVELEEKFVGFIKDNKAYAEKRLGHAIDLTIIQGDSRNLSTLLQERGVIQIMSPPYIECGEPHTVDNLTAGRSDGKARGGSMVKAVNILQAPGQIGNMPEGMGLDENSYWGSMFRVYAESLKVADVMVLVTKDPTRKGKLHPLGQMTADLITEIGWRIVDWKKAILYDTQEQGDLFGGVKKKRSGRISFFKRLSLDKGNVAADHEDVIFAVNPNGRRSGIVEVTSPPYSDSEGHPSLGSVNNDNWGTEGKDIASRRGKTGVYGATPGQIGNMPEGRVIISSPPYVGQECKWEGGIKWDKAGRPDRLIESPNRHNVQGANVGGYGFNPANIGNMKE